MSPPTRRRLLSAAAGSVAALAALAGCSGGGGDDGDGATTTTDDGPGTTTGSDAGTDAGPGGTTTTTEATSDPGDGTTTREDYSPPDTEFGFVYDAEASTLIMANTGVGDFTAANTDRLAIEVDGEVARNWELPVEGGDQTTVQVDPGASVELVWISPADDRQVVASYEVPAS